MVVEACRKAAKAAVGCGGAHVGLEKVVECRPSAGTATNLLQYRLHGCRCLWAHIWPPALVVGMRVGGRLNACCEIHGGLRPDHSLVRDCRVEMNDERVDACSAAEQTTGDLAKKLVDVRRIFKSNAMKLLLRERLAG